MTLALHTLAAAADLLAALCRALSAASGAFSRSLLDELVTVPNYVPDFMTQEP